MEVMGPPPQDFIMKGNRKGKYFDEHFKPKVVPNSRGKVRVPGSTSLDEVFKGADSKFIDLVKHCLVYDPRLRYTPDEALAHEWVLEGLPKHIQTHHLKLVENAGDRNTSKNGSHNENPEGYYIAQPKNSARKNKNGGGVYTEASKDVHA
mmetsp:Transcript_12490/g.10740  ORF Transcript_12490/g.10740 Transcript_12490/m.10740 type:complete len:150 (-) Transcript_12490:78-527(-)